jgi:hypothetical protein
MAYSWLLQIAPEQRKAVGAMLSVGSIQYVSDLTSNSQFAGAP